MKKGQKYIYITDNEVDRTSKIEHPIIKKLREKGVTQIELIYGSHWATDAGWIILSCKTKTGRSPAPGLALLSKKQYLI